MEAAGDSSAPGLYATPRCRAFWALTPSLTADSTHSEDIDTTQADHAADALRYLLTSVNDKRYSGQLGITNFRLTA